MGSSSRLDLPTGSVLLLVATKACISGPLPKKAQKKPVRIQGGQNTVLRKGNTKILTGFVGHIKKVCPRGPSLSRLSASSGEPGCSQPRQNARLQNRFQSNNNRFKLLLPQPSLLQLGLAILTIEGCEGCSQDTLLLQ
jgi:hypothetical protein